MKTHQVTFDSAGTRCVGQLYGADGGSGRPCVILCTGFSGTQDTPSIVATAEAFADAGYLALTFDYRSFGTSDGTPRQVVDVKGQLADIHAAVAFARGHSGVDPERIVLWGTSLGGGHVVTVAAQDTRIAAVVAQVPFNGFPKKVEGRSPKATRALLFVMVKDRLRGLLGLEPTYIPAVGQTNELAVMASPQAKQTIAVMDGETWKNSVAPRGIFSMMRYKPGDHAPRVRTPLLVCIGEHDRETIGADTVELADRAPRGELRTYPVAHFDFYRPEIRELVTKDQLHFVGQVLGRTGREAR